MMPLGRMACVRRTSNKPGNFDKSLSLQNRPSPRFSVEQGLRGPLAFTCRRLKQTNSRWGSTACVSRFRSGRLCRAKACCLACWQGNLPDYDILVKCVLRASCCVSCARVMARGAITRLTENKRPRPGSTEHRHAFLKPNASVRFRALAFAFLSVRFFRLVPEQTCSRPLRGQSCRSGFSLTVFPFARSNLQAEA